MKKVLAVALCALIGFSSCSKDENEIEVPEQGQPKLVLSEEFTDATLGTTVDSGGDLWEGNENFPTVSRTYQAAGTVKVASSSVHGSIETKVLNLSANSGKVTVKFKVKGWFANAKMVVTVGEESQTVDIEADRNAETLEEKELTFNSGTANSTIKFETGTVIFNEKEQVSRFFIDDVQVIN